MSETATGQAAAKADGFLLSCIDPRLTDDTTMLMTSLGRTDRYSEMRVAGAALALVDSNRPAWSTAVWENLAASRALHGIRKVTLLNHRDCGAMHLWAGRRLAEDPAEELRVHAEVMNRAAAEVRARHPDLGIELKLMELDGSVRILPCEACSPRGLRAEAVAPAAPAPAGRDSFADLVRVRRDGPRSPGIRLALLTEGVTRYGLTARDAQEIHDAVAGEGGGAQPQSAARDVATFLATRSDTAGRIGRADMRAAGDLHRRLNGGQGTRQEAERQAATIAEQEGLRPRPEGVWPFRSTAWFRPADAAR